MEITELEKLDAQIKELQEKRKAVLDSQRDEKLREVKTLLNQFGFTASELGLTAKKRGVAKTKGEAKYAHPTDPELTWAGRGRQPHWVKEYLAAGKVLKDLEI